MKKIILSILLFSLIQPVCLAAKMKAVALNNFTTKDNNAKIRIFVAEDFYLNNNILIPEKSFLIGQIADIKEPKRLKKNASFKFLVLYFMDSQKNMYKLTSPLLAKYGKTIELDGKKMAQSGALYVAGKIVPGASYIYHGAQGAKNAHGSKFKGAMNGIYENSFLSWKDKGSHLNIKKYDCFYLIFPKCKDSEYTHSSLFTPIDKKGNILIEYNKDGTIKQYMPSGSELEINYPLKHQKKGKIRYLSRPKKES